MLLECIMNNPYEYQTDLGGYNSEVNSIINQRAERLAAIRGGMEYKRDSRVAQLQSKAGGLESSAREWMEGGIGGGLGAKELISGAPNIRKGYANLKKGVNFVKRKFNEYKANQTNQADDTANEEQPVQEDETQAPVEEQEPPSQTSNLNSADREVDIFEGTGRDGTNPSDYARGQAGQRVRAKLDDEANQETATEETQGETDATGETGDETGDLTSNVTKDITGDVEDDALKTIGTDLGESSVFDWLGVKSFNRKLEEYKTFVKKIKSDGRMKYKIQWAKLMEHLQAQGYLYEYEEEDEEDSSSDEDD